MIRPPVGGGVAFTEAADGDMRGDAQARAAVSAQLGISELWATVWQVHGSQAVRVGQPGECGAADAVFTTTPWLPCAVFTADCLGVVVEAEGGVGVAHAGWRGLASGVIPELIERMEDSGLLPVRASMGPSIGPCCYEVGPEVLEAFPDHAGTTTWGTPSVDLGAVAAAQLEALPVWRVDRCTRHDGGSFSHRLDGTPARMATIGWWIP